MNKDEIDAVIEQLEAATADMNVLAGKPDWMILNGVFIPLNHERAMTDERNHPDYLPYIKPATQQLRPYIEGESIGHISIPEDVVPKVGDMIAYAENNHDDVWLVQKEFFDANYEYAGFTVDDATAKTLCNTDQDKAQDNVKDIKFFGDDLFVLLSKASSKAEGWMKSTKAMQCPDGCLVQVTTQQGDHVAEALEYVPGVEIFKHQNDHGEVSKRFLTRMGGNSEVVS